MNYELMWFELKKYITSKNSHGKNELLGKMVEKEIEASTVKINGADSSTGKSQLEILGY